jgi:hypothetical protein
MYNTWVRKPEGNRPFGRARCRREKNIKMDPTERVCGNVK